MNNSEFDRSSVSSLLAFAKRLTGKSLAEVSLVPKDIATSQSKGDLGSLVEAFYFLQPPSSSREPDFPEAGLELKTTGVVRDAKLGYKAKERLVLTMINYEEIVTEDWETSALYRKCRLILVLFYLYEKDRPVVDRRFVIDPMLYCLEKDMSAIRRDWETIKQKVVLGKAHELSEGDTFFLAASRKGPGGLKETLRVQPFSSVGAKSRAFSFKPKFMTALLQNHLNGQEPEDSLGLSRGIKFEDAIQKRLERFVGREFEEIAHHFGLEKVSKNQKNFHRQLAVRMLAEGGDSVTELNRAGIEMKSVRLTKTGRPRESMSFPAFDFVSLVSEEWEESTLFSKIESIFLFVVFRLGSDNVERFVGARLWTMPYEDRVEVQRVWEETRSRVQVDARNLPGPTESRIAHVRPKGKNGQDKIMTPQGGLHLRQAFWLNSQYVRSILNGL